VINKLQKTVDELVTWGKTCGLQFNESKTVVMHFSRKSKVCGYKLKMNNKYLEYSNTVTYLGVLMDRRLEWKQHIEEKLHLQKDY
jgi:hypothetical protein